MRSCTQKITAEYMLCGPLKNSAQMFNINWILGKSLSLPIEISHLTWKISNSVVLVTYLDLNEEMMFENKIQFYFCIHIKCSPNENVKNVY